MVDDNLETWGRKRTFHFPELLVLVTFEMFLYQKLFRMFASRLISGVSASGKL